MSEFAPEVVSLEPTAVAVVRETVPMNELTSFFDRAFHAVAEAVGAQGVALAGPPFGAYYGMPTDTVDLAAGFPVQREVVATGDVVASTLPGGRAAQVMHVGSYDSLGQTYDRLFGWMRQQGLTPDSMMWESYLTEPDADNPDATLTRITWPIVQ